MELIDNRNKILKEDLASELKSGSKMSIAAACFSIYAFQELRKELKGIDELRFIFTSPSFTTENAPKEKREFYIPRMNRERSLYGTEFEVKLRNELTEIPPEVKRVEIKDEPSMPPIKQPSIDNLFPGRYPKYDENLVGSVVLAKTGFNKIVLGLVIDSIPDYITIDRDEYGIKKYNRKTSFLKNSIWVLEEYSNLSQNKKDDPLGFRWLTK